MGNKSKISYVQALLIAVGFVIGSGIFFRADNILSATQGNVLIAIMGWIFLGTTLIFAGLAVSIIAERTNGIGGIGSYIEDLYGKKAGYIVGFFMSTLYAPILISVLSIVMMGYMKQLFGWEDLIAGQGFYLAVVALLFVIYFWNFMSAKFASRVSSAATMIKVIPLIIVGLVGILFGDASNITVAGLHANSAVEAYDPNAGFFVLFAAPFVSMGFALDGWISVAALTNDMENPKRDLPKVLVFGTSIIIAIYVLYFVGVSMLMPPEEIIASGDSHVTIIATDIFGAFGGKLIITGIIVSVLGTLNSNIMAGIRYPHAVATSNDFMMREKMLKVNEKTGIPTVSGIYCIVVAAIFLSLYALQETQGILNGIVIDDIPVFILSLFYIAILFGVYKIGRRENLSKFKTIFAPIVGALGQLVILIAFYVTNDKALIYTVILIIYMTLGYFARNLFNKK